MRITVWAPVYPEMVGMLIGIGVWGLGKPEAQGLFGGFSSTRSSGNRRGISHPMCLAAIGAGGDVSRTYRCSRPQTEAMP